MASLRDQFQHFYQPGDDEVVKAIKTGIVTPDTNVLLALYRLQPDMRDQWFGALAALNDRLWVPHQVATEFHRRRLDVIKEKEHSFKATEDELKALFKRLRAKVEQFGTSIGLEKDHIQGVTEGITSLQTSLTAEINAARKASDVRFLGTKIDKSDKVFERLDNLLGDRIGDAMSPAELAEAQTEALRRVGLEIPLVMRTLARSTRQVTIWSSGRSWSTPESTSSRSFS
jgi:PIN like domain